MRECDVETYREFKRRIATFKLTQAEADATVRLNRLGGEENFSLIDKEEARAISVRLRWIRRKIRTVALELGILQSADQHFREEMENRLEKFKRDRSKQVRRVRSPKQKGKRDSHLQGAEG